MKGFEAPANSLLERWEGRFFTAERHGIQFLDPVYNEPLEPYTPPRSVLEDPLLGEGLRTLQRLSNDRGSTLQLVLGLHGSAEHFREIAAQHQTVLQRPRFIGIEANWRAAKAAQDTPLPQHYRTRIVGATGRRGFQLEQLRWLRRNNKSALPCELRDDYATDLTRRMDELWQTYELATANEGGQFDKTERHYIRTCATYAYQTVRHWILPGMLGAWYGQIHKSGGLTEDSKDPVLIAGAGHAPDGERLRHLNIRVAVHHTEHAVHSEHNWLEVFKKGVGEARLSHAETAVALPF